MRNGERERLRGGGGPRGSGPLLISLLSSTPSNPLLTGLLLGLNLLTGGGLLLTGLLDLLLLLELTAPGLRCLTGLL